MEEVNKNTELDNIDKKLHISDVSVSLYTENEAKELAYKILCFSLPNGYMLFANRESFEHSWETIIGRGN